MMYHTLVFFVSINCSKIWKYKNNLRATLANSEQELLVTDNKEERTTILKKNEARFSYKEKRVYEFAGVPLENHYAPETHFKRRRTDFDAQNDAFNHSQREEQGILALCRIKSGCNIDEAKNMAYTNANNILFTKKMAQKFLCNDRKPRYGGRSYVEPERNNARDVGEEQRMRIMRNRGIASQHQTSAYSIDKEFSVPSDMSSGSSYSFSDDSQDERVLIIDCSTETQQSHSNGHEDSQNSCPALPERSNSPNATIDITEDAESLVKKPAMADALVDDAKIEKAYELRLPNKVAQDKTGISLTRHLNNQFVNFDGSGDLIASHNHLSLSFLSYGFPNDKHVSKAKNDQGVKNDKKDRNLNWETLVADAPHFTYTCKIELDFDEQFLIFNLLCKDLFGKGDAGYIVDGNKDMFSDIIIDNTTNKNDLYSWFKDMEPETYSYKTVQKIYTIVLASKILVYDEKLECFVIRQDQLSMAVYFTEYYYYAMWKLGQMNLEIDDNSRKTYNTLLSKELKFLCVIIDIYYELKKPESQLLHREKLIALIYHQIEQLRFCILEYLETFHPLDRRTTLYHLACRMKHVSKNKITNPKILEGRLTIDDSLADDASVDQNNEKNGYKRRQKNEQNSTEYYHRFHEVKYTKMPIFILAFTVDFITYARDIPLWEQVLKMLINVKMIRAGAEYIIKTEIMRGRTEFAPFENAFDNIMNFLILFIKYTRPHDANSENNLKYYKTFRSKIYHQYIHVYGSGQSDVFHRMTSYRDTIIKIMNIDR